MSYLEEPKSVQLSYPDCDKNVESLNWASIKSHVQSSDLYMTDDINQHLGSCDASLDAHLSLARLCREIGHRNDAKYNTTSTSVTVNRLVFGTIQRFHLTEWLPNRTVSGFTKLVQYNSLFEGVKDGIVLLNGIDDSYGGHAWVADGAVKNGTITYITHTGEIDPSTGKELVSTRENLKTYFHFNWGWNGNNNGFFDAGVFAPQNQSKDPVVASLDLVPSSPYDFSDYVEYCVIK